MVKRDWNWGGELGDSNQAHMVIGRIYFFVVVGLRPSDLSSCLQLPAI
jgi:hypothetical protein